MPYLELSGGTLFTNHDVPSGTDRVNFTSSAALGAHFLGDSRNWSVELRYMHISNAGLSDPQSRDQHGPGAVGNRKVFR